MVTRRQVIQGSAAFLSGATGLGGYALAVEPNRLAITRYGVRPSRWANGPRLRIVVLADLHICEPWLPVARVEEIVGAANALAPDVIVLLGDFETRHRLARPVEKAEWARALAQLRAPLGVYAILGNHDWWEDGELQRSRSGPTPVGRALDKVAIPVLENGGLRLEKDARPFWLLGLGDQWAFYLDRHGNGKNGRFGFEGVDDLPATLATMTDDAPAVLLVHEPDIFVDVPDRVALTLAGHTHGGQVSVFGWSPIVPSRFGQRYAYGHVVESGRNLIVSGGLGCSGLPVRLGRPPEIVVVELAA